MFTTSLIVLHSMLSGANLTTWECLSWRRISYMQSWRRRDGSPFGIGCLGNLGLYCCYRLGARNFYVWRMPKTSPFLADTH